MAAWAADQTEECGQRDKLVITLGTAGLPLVLMVRLGVTASLALLRATWD